MTNPHPNGWEVGMEVIAVIDRNGGGRARVYPSKITKIGRRWISFKPKSGPIESRFDAESMLIDGGQYGSPGRVYTSMAEYEETLERNKTWREFRSRLDYKPPNHLTLARIKAIHTEVFPE